MAQCKPLSRVTDSFLSAFLSPLWKFQLLAVTQRVTSQVIQMAGLVQACQPDGRKLGQAFPHKGLIRKKSLQTVSFKTLNQTQEPKALLTRIPTPCSNCNTCRLYALLYSAYTDVAYHSLVLVVYPSEELQLIYIDSLNVRAKEWRFILYLAQIPLIRAAHIPEYTRKTARWPVQSTACPGRTRRTVLYFHI